MNKRWKALASVTVALALVIAPLATAGAVADEVPPPEETTEVVAPVEEVTPPVEEVVPPAEVVADPVEEPVAEPVADPEPIPVQPPAEAVVPPVENSVISQGYVLALWAADTPGTQWPQHLVTSIKTSSTSLDALDDTDLLNCTYYQVDLYADNETTASLLAGGVLNGPNNPAESWPGGYYKSSFSKTWTTTCPPPPNDPPTVTIVPDCGNEAGNILVTATNPNAVTVPVTLYLDFNLDGQPDASEVLQVVPGVTTLHYQFGEDVTVGIAVYFGETPVFSGSVVADCEPETYPVPAFFNADAPAPTCASAAEFVTPGELTAGGEVIYQDEDVTVWSFENVDVAIWRDIPGEVFIQVYAHDGFTLSGLSEAWDVSDDGTYAERTIILLDAIGFQNEDPAQPCFFAIVPQPAAPTFTDACGTANDGYDVPNGTDEFAYEVVEDGDTVTVTAVLLNDANEWAEGTVTEWSFTFTDAACPTGTTPPAPTGSLAATGGGDVNPLIPLGASMLVVAGAALMVLRRMVRQ